MNFQSLPSVPSEWYLKSPSKGDSLFSDLEVGETFVQDPVNYPDQANFSVCIRVNDREYMRLGSVTRYPINNEKVFRVAAIACFPRFPLINALNSEQFVDPYR